MPVEWKHGIMVSFFKNKGDAQSCSNYREVEISENQFAFMSGRSSTVAIHLVIRLMEKFRERLKDLHMVFIDLDKAYDIILRDVIWRSLEEMRVSGVTNEEAVDVMIADQIIPRTDKFKYLGSIIQKECEVDDDVTHRIKAEWLKWRSATEALCDKKVPLKLKA
ncbi:hypothetical protein OROGR_026399 [Orobanche gracilis]